MSLSDLVGAGLEAPVAAIRRTASASSLAGDVQVTVSGLPVMT